LGEATRFLDIAADPVFLQRRDAGDGVALNGQLIRTLK